MSSTAFRAGQARLLARAAQSGARQGPTARPRRRSLAAFLVGTRRLVAAVAMSILVLFGVATAGTVAAASSSLPGSPLYSVKRTTEAIVTLIAPTPQLQTRVHLAWAERRLREFEALMQREGAADDSLLAALDQETEQALIAAELAGSDSLEATLALTEHQQAVLNRLLEKAPPSARPGLERALTVSAQRNAHARSALERTTKPGPPVTPPGQAEEKLPPGQEKKTGPATETPASMPVDANQAGDETRPTPQGQSQDVKPGQGQGSGQGHDTAHEQDQVGGSDQGQGQGQGQGPGKKDELNPPGKDQETGQGSDLDNGSNPGQSGEKPGRPEDPGQGGGQDKDKDKNKDNGKK